MMSPELGAVPVFDACVRAPPLRPAELDHLHFLGVRAVILSAPLQPPARSVAEVEARLRTLVEQHRVRWARSGFEVAVMVGLHPLWAPPRDRHQALHHVQQLAKHPEIVALGELGLQEGGPLEAELLKRQIGIAQDTGLPIVLASDGATDQARRLEEALEIVLRADFDMERCLVRCRGPELAELVAAAGARVSLSVGPEPATREAAIDWLEGTDQRAIVDGGIEPGVDDLMALAKASRALSNRGWSQARLRRLVWAEPTHFFFGDKRRR